MNIKETIKSHGYTQEDVAKRLGVTRETLNRTISNNPTISTLSKIADVLGCNIVDFFQETDTKEAAHLVCPHCGAELCVKIEKVEKPQH